MSAHRAHSFRRLQDVPMVLEPFPHIIVNDFLPADLYASACAQWPDHDDFGILQPDDLPARYQAPLTERWLRQCDPERAAVWRDVRNCLFNPDIIDLMADRFPQVAAKRGWVDAPPQLNARIIQDHTGHAMLPHTDIEATLFSMLLYMPPPDWVPDPAAPPLGTALYRPRDPEFRGRGFDRYPRADFDLVSHAPYQPNHLLVYAPSDRSFHGVEPVTGPCERRLLIFFAVVETRPPSRRNRDS
ncbi:hypothetical protein [Niveispirillum irakense]|uniref:hypothetical protein n=1 Tax=Niveispirillum irakense TaxID=34011 RepID=UPI000A0486D2|nr:hypothetical protein [Niveispirillum irakense]